MVFQSWNLDVTAFCPLKKCFGITMSWLRGDGEICHRKCALKKDGLNLRAIHLQENYEQKQTFADVRQSNCS